jgi:hypothetical protein
MELSEIVLTALGIYEVLSRVIKTSSTWSLIGKILNAVKAVSDYLDNIQKDD